ncbi:MAG: hypothetical protein G01um101472_497 [Parcubacteria group bacterium Gr01-1014_72]|nr:MAG: hypothetical protein G01um101472_497 [Parcubacteria group bacterium Gr01-1014_72]
MDGEIGEYTLPRQSLYCRLRSRQPDGVYEVANELIHAYLVARKRAFILANQAVFF